MMEFIEFNPTAMQDDLLGFLLKIEWKAGEMLHKHLTAGTFYKRFGQSAQLFFLLDQDTANTDVEDTESKSASDSAPACAARNSESETARKIAGFGAIVEQDFIEIPEFSPWIAFIYVNPEYRGQHLSERIVNFLEAKLKEMENREIYILTQHIGLYEKYGYAQIGDVPSEIHGTAYIYKKELN
ncbi:GNAT family N-acetyltransferase [Arcanobacterium hippocoleae]|uniref:Ribosomal protein S18 acetylase RimI-like enzyme n=1 Tax=Arcanobacterium hippocoleae TaxID=149017 RepID=A0ABU1T2Q0_9ACTO|nr:GNAT family N-acetyltransferase [Arcanobacterium hippocoleae]MDR6939618.1 ribosomal protein S18 acetylase RimI-like enzyme [Arcanobacterium hippocoleae]